MQCSTTLASVPSGRDTHFSDAPLVVMQCSTTLASVPSGRDTHFSNAPLAGTTSPDLCNQVTWRLPLLFLTSMPPAMYPGHVAFALAFLDRVSLRSTFASVSDL
ncbi:hypothetical protein ACOMHN_028647 [Nucella lapillus]